MYRLFVILYYSFHRCCFPPLLYYCTLF